MITNYYYFTLAIQKQRKLKRSRETPSKAIALRLSEERGNTGRGRQGSWGQGKSERGAYFCPPLNNGLLQSRHCVDGDS